MGGEWVTGKLESLVDVNPARRLKKGDIYSFISMDQLVPFVRHVGVKETKHFTGSGSKFQNGDTLLARITPCLENGKTAYVDSLDSDKGFGSTEFIVLTGKRNISDPLFIYYLARSDLFRANAISLMEGTSGRQRVPAPALSRLTIKIPPLPEQKAIAHILGSLDDKIELNRKMNETLEAMARAIFKSWFVDFDPVRAKAEGRKPDGMDEETAKLFPDSFEDSELGLIPKGWRVAPLSDSIELIGGGTPKTNVEEYWNGNIPWFSVVDAPSISDVFVIDTEKHITEAGSQNSSTKVLRKGTTIISARGTVGKLALVGNPMAMNQSCYGILGIRGQADYYTYYRMRAVVLELQRSAHGSVFDTITRETFKSVRHVMPPAIMTVRFDETILSQMEHIRNNLKTNAIVTNTRDALLPKLLSGQLRIKDAEKIVEGVL